MEVEILEGDLRRDGCAAYCAFENPNRICGNRCAAFIVKDIVVKEGGTTTFITCSRMGIDTCIIGEIRNPGPVVTHTETKEND